MVPYVKVLNFEIMEEILCILIDLILAGLAIWFIVVNFMYYLS